MLGLNELLIDPNDGSLHGFAPVYVWFNLIEAGLWLACAVWVLRLGWRAGLQRGDLLYGTAFVLFAISDLVETQGWTLMLLLFKAATLIAILACRQLALQRRGGRWI